MNTVVDEFKAVKYMVLALDEYVPPKAYNRFLIDGKVYVPVPVYDAKNCIAVESDESFLGKRVEYLWMEVSV